MEFNFKSEYYTDFPATMTKYGIPEDAFEFAGDFQAHEEMQYSFSLYLLM